MDEHRRHDESHNPLERIEERLERLEFHVNQLGFELAAATFKLFSEIEQILEFLTQETPETSVVDFRLQQFKGESPVAINGIVAGTQAKFAIGFVPATNFVPLQSGPTVAVDDPLVVLGAVDSSNNFTADSTSAAASCNITVNGVNDQGATITHSFNIPLLPAPPPPPVSVTDFSLSQVN